ncbi:hypothetical protein F7D01_06860 [Erythrobacter sp. 3-20A1M]|uniref:energy transducer TonB n=1 Tax=Erythrobacter sp. 3-20A1M TaxID=2653850 RepID=UPI001BFC4F58|nr:energy transducer TonB [Erythrobacter sp. 3-20A1M]QWC56850.1 hypothetical protein F7D01_06860 [Erythrobacter sp. 3-20A1M]
MKNCIVLGLAALGLATQSPAALAREPVVLKPNSPWQLDYAESACRLTRSFGEADDPVVLVIAEYAPGDSFSMIVAGKPLRALTPRSASNAELSVRFDPDGQPTDTFVNIGTLGDFKPALIFGTTRLDPLPEGFFDDVDYDTDWDYQDPPEVSAERRNAASRLVLGKGKDDRVILETGSLGEAFAAMDKCLDSLVESWGFDPAMVAAQERPAVPLESPGRWIRPGDYPKNALDSGQQGMVHFRLMIDATGKPTDCIIQGATKPAGFEDVTCDNLLKRARFKPALAADGAPVASFYTNTVRFQIP